VQATRARVPVGPEDALTTRSDLDGAAADRREFERWIRRSYDIHVHDTGSPVGHGRSDLRVPNADRGCEPEVINGYDAWIARRPGLWSYRSNIRCGKARGRPDLAPRQRACHARKQDARVGPDTQQR